MVCPHRPQCCGRLYRKFSHSESYIAGLRLKNQYLAAHMSKKRQPHPYTMQNRDDCMGCCVAAIFMRVSHNNPFAAQNIGSLKPIFTNA